ncbi:hypothetical protein Tsubulata_032403 [Turnera subulata]|uniref:Uncharacterized protein n=1 Tax=Turnera subulata TaxID=218843 RepID=A0A9Q0F4H8_9ROSI|nr:hypothetical protein Tsubulata_032403 [Turnera subulata]
MKQEEPGVVIFKVQLNQVRTLDLRGATGGTGGGDIQGAIKPMSLRCSLTPQAGEEHPLVQGIIASAIRLIRQEENAP